MLNRSQYNSTRYNESLQAGLQSLSNPSSEKYRLTVHDSTGRLLAFLPMAYNGKATERVNGIGQLSLSYPLPESESAYLTFPNQIWLYDLFGQIIEKFHILQTETTQTTDGNYVLNVEAESLISQLGNEIIIGDASGLTIQQILTFVFNENQVADSRIYLGSIDSGIRNLVRFMSLKGESILEVIRQMADTVPDSVYWVDPQTRRFHWKYKRETYQGKHITFGYNLAGIRKRKDGSTIVNRVYVFGEDDTHYKKGLAWAGEPNDYMDNASSISQYGIKQRKFILKNAHYPEQLLEFAEQALQTFAQPRTSYEIDTLDLYNNGNISNDFLRFRPGQEIRVSHPEIGVEARNLIVEVTRNLDSPLDMQIVFAERVPSIESGFEELGRRLKAEENSPSPTTENIIDALTDVVITEDGEDEHAKHNQLIETIAEAVNQVLEDDITAEIQDTRSEFIERIVEAITEQLTEHSGETVTQEFIDALKEALIDDLIEELKEDFPLVYVAESFDELPSDVELIAFGRVENSGADEDDGKLYKRNAGNSEWEPIGQTIFYSEDTKANLDTLIEDETEDGVGIGFTTGATQRFYARIGDDMICLTHLE